MDREERMGLTGIRWRLEEREKRKYEVAEGCGRLPRLEQDGGAGLTAKEAGRMGGRMRGQGGAARRK